MTSVEFPTIFNISVILYVPVLRKLSISSDSGLLLAVSSSAKAGPYPKYDPKSVDVFHSIN